jgi:hypothetical protein
MASGFRDNISGDLPGESTRDARRFVLLKARLFA